MSVHADPGDKLVRMANQIASFFRPYPEDEAIAGVHEHIVAFWSPVMRQNLLARADRTEEGVDPIVSKAVYALKTGVSPARRESAGPGEAGELGASDAG